MYNPTPPIKIDYPWRQTIIDDWVFLPDSIFKLCKLKLAEIEANGPYARLIYKWDDDLTYTEADYLDTRLRAYISGAIYDAAVESGVSCQTGPLHGIRPSWFIENSKIPISLVEAGFNFAEKSCWLTLGPIIMIMNVSTSEEQNHIAAILANAFALFFKELEV